MKKANNKSAGPPPRDEFDFSKGVRGKYARRFAQGTNVVVLESEVAKVFPSSKAVNSSLRGLAGIIRQQEKALAAKQPVGKPLGGRSLPAPTARP